MACFPAGMLIELFRLDLKRYGPIPAIVRSGFRFENVMTDLGFNESDPERDSYIHIWIRNTNDEETLRHKLAHNHPPRSVFNQILDQHLTHYTLSTYAILISWAVPFTSCVMRFGPEVVFNPTKQEIVIYLSYGGVLAVVLLHQFASSMYDKHFDPEEIQARKAEQES